METEIPRSHGARVLQVLASDPDKNLYQANPLNEGDYREMRDLFRPILRLMGILGLFHPSKRACSEQVPNDIATRTASAF